MLPLPPAGHDKQRNDFSIRIELVTMTTRLRASPRHVGAGSFFLNFSVIDPPRWRPFGAAVFIEIERVFAL
jgi:hypothetical protein